MKYIMFVITCIVLGCGGDIAGADPNTVQVVVDKDFPWRGELATALMDWGRISDRNFILADQEVGGIKTVVVHVRQTDKPLGDGMVGYAEWAYLNQPGQVLIGPDAFPQNVGQILRHELGHSVFHLRHIDDPKCIMFPSVTGLGYVGECEEDMLAGLRKEHYL